MTARKPLADRGGAAVVGTAPRWTHWLAPSEHTFSKLPAKVRDNVEAQKASSERLIGWVQLGVLGLFALLFGLSPTPAGPAPSIAPEPWFLGAYFAFTLLRLWLAYRRRLSPWVLYLSSFIDIALLLGLIWTFHIKYGQPASFYLKAPTLLYVFIFISLRALRFEARYVLFAGLCAIAGWLAMVGYVVVSEAGNPMITRNYVVYLTSNSVLIGAEIDKVISIALVTVILAVAIHRARRLLEASVLQGAAADNLSRFVPDAVALRVRHSDTAIEAGLAETRTATVLYTDIADFTSICERLEPEEVIVALNEYFEVVSEPITRRGGVIGQFQGDAILAIFNLPDPDERHATHALHAALEIQDRVHGRRFGQRAGEGVALETRIGITTGDVVGGFVGTQDRLHYTVHGDQVNLAARLEQLNKELGTRILVSGATRDAVSAQEFALRPVGDVEIRGHRGRVEIYALGEV